MTRVDGRFDIAVNGGEVLVVDYSRPEFMTLQRSQDVPWQQFVDVDDVVMKRYDSRVTTIDTDLDDPFQVATGTPITDSDGTRQATLLFARDTNAVMELPNGTTQPLDDLHVRATEYTVGADGDEAMPGELPETSAYTYAVEFSVDEAVEAGATDVRFDKPVISYLDNFLEFPTGTQVPAAHYDRERSVWVPANDGIVLEILGEELGFAIVDTDGDGAPDTPERLDELGITADERRELHARYPIVGTSLWRVLVRHFTPWDCNWAFTCEDPECTPPNEPPPPPPPCPDCMGEGSEIGFFGQTLGEELSLTGTPFRLRYSSDRMPGYKEAFAVDIPVSGPSIGSLVRGVVVSVNVAGREHTELLPPAPNLKREFIWDGKDAYGRTVQGAQTALVRVGYVYRMVYMKPSPTAFASSFARFGEFPLSANEGRREITAWQQWERPLGIFRVANTELGGWTLDVHHAYDPQAQALYRGDGSRLTTAAIKPETRTVAGVGQIPGDTPARQTELGHVRGIAAGSDGDFYVADTENGVIYEVTSTGEISVVAGGGAPADGLGDGGLATGAQLVTPSDIEPAPGGGFYISDTGNGRIRFVSPAGIITTVAGGGERGSLGDDGPATAAFLKHPRGIALGGDGSLYVADTGHDRVRHMTPDGRIATAAGGGTPADGLGDGGLAPRAALDSPYDVAISPTGGLYVADGLHQRIRRVRPDGTIETVAGNGGLGNSGDGGPATQAQIGQPQGLDVARDGTIFFADRLHHVVRKVTTNGFISTHAGTGQTGGLGGLGEGAPPLQTQLSFPHDVATTPTGAVLVADSGNAVVRRMGASLPGFTGADFIVPSDDGTEVYAFTESGRHLRTLNALTGALRYEFDYDAAGRLASVTDGDGQETTIERAADGTPTAVVAPGGQRTVLGITGDYLTSVANPAGDETVMSYAPGGLLASLTSPEGGEQNFEYDARGRLVRDEGSDGGFQTLARTETPTGPTVEITTRLGRKTVYRYETLPDGGQRRTMTRPSGATTTALFQPDGRFEISYPDGTEATIVFRPDPRFGMRAPELTTVVETPGGVRRETRESSIAVLTDPDDPLSVESHVDRLTVVEGGTERVRETRWETATRTFTTTYPEGRQRSVTLDEKGRLIRAQNGNLAPLTRSYDAHGHLVSETVGSGLSARTTSYEYDAQGNLVRVVDPMARSTTFQWDAAGHVTSMTLPGARTVAYELDADGRKTSISPPGRPAHRFEYTPGGRQTVYAPPSLGPPSETRRSYNLDGQLTRITRPEGTTVDFGYDSFGRLVSALGPLGQTNYTYDHGDTISAIGTPGGGTSLFGHDGTLLARTAWTGPMEGRVDFGYDSAFRKAAESVNGAPSLTFAHDQDDYLTRAGALTMTLNQTGFVSGTTLDGVTTTSSYDEFGDEVARSAAVGASTLYQAMLSRDALGRITEKVETIEGESTTYTYTYNDAGRVIEVARDGVIEATYAYDANGNRIVANGASSVYDDQDRLVSSPGTTYTYNASGDLTSRTSGGQTTTYEYDQVGNLRSVVLPTGERIDYVVDGYNQRVGKKVEGIVVQGFLYGEGAQIVAEVDGANVVVSRFVYGTETSNVPDYMVKGSTRYRFVKDHLGSPRLVVNSATGAVVQRLDFDEFGRVVRDTNPGFQPFGFAGGLYDAATGLVRFGERDYDAEAGRWTTKDPIGFAGGDTNLYAYVGNDPVNGTDPLGLNGIGKNDFGDLPPDVPLPPDKVGKYFSCGVSVTPGRLRTVSLALKRIDLPDPKKKPSEACQACKKALGTWKQNFAKSKDAEAKRNTYPCLVGLEEVCDSICPKLVC